MKRIVIAVAVGLALMLSAGLVFAQLGWGPMGPGMSMGPGMDWGPGMMGPGGGPGYCFGEGQFEATQVTEEKAKEVAQQYADKYLKGFTVEKVLPFTGRRGATMYSVELKGPNDELRILHVNPWGNVMPFGGPGRRVG